MIVLNKVKYSFSNNSTKFAALEKICISISLIISLIIAIFYEKLIPESFQRDTKAIVAYLGKIEECAKNYNLGVPYCFVINIYTHTTYALFGNTRILVAFIQLGIAFISLGILRFVVFKKIRPKLPLIIFESITILLLAVYLGLYSKEFFIFAILILPIIITLTIFQTKLLNKLIISDFILIIILLLNTKIFKGYYILWIGFYIITRIVCYKKITTLKVSIAYLVSIVGVGIMQSLVKIFKFSVVDIVATRDFNFNKLPEESTRISSFHFNHNPLLEVPLSCIKTLIDLLLPISMFTHPSIRRIICFITLFGLTIFIFFILKLLLYKNSDDYKLFNFNSVKSLEQNKLSYQVVILFVSFIMMSSVFEPDYGSYLRHLSMLTPLLLYGSWFCYNNITTQKR